MKVKTSLTLSDDLVEALDRMAGPDVSRSAFVESILRDFVESQARAKRHAKDVAAINRHAAYLNAEALDILTFQAPWPEE